MNFMDKANTIAKLLEKVPSSSKKRYVCYQNIGHDMTWKRFNFKKEKEALRMYKLLEGNEARVLYIDDEKVEQDGEKEMTDLMEKHAEEHYKKETKPTPE